MGIRRTERGYDGWFCWFWSTFGPAVRGVSSVLSLATPRCCGRWLPIWLVHWAAAVKPYSESAGSTMRLSTPVRILVGFLLLCFVSAGLRAEERVGRSVAEADVKLQQVRDRILWFDEEKTAPRLIPEDVFEMGSFEALPIPERDRQGIRLWIGFRTEWRSPAGETYPECTLPRRITNEPVSPDDQKTVKQVIMNGPVSLLVKVEKATRGLWPTEGIYQFNEVTPVEILVGGDFPYQNPFSTRAFMSEGGAITVEGVRLCTFSPWHDSPPRAGDTYLLVGGPDDKGVFQNTYYFRVEDGVIVPANYARLKRDAEPLTLEQLGKDLAKLRRARE